MTNILLFIFDFIIALPITLIRLLLIYLFGSKYNINSLGFLDIMMHADKKYFNQEDPYPTLDTLKDDIRVRINYDSRCNKDILVISNNKKCVTCNELKESLHKLSEENKKIVQGNNHKENKIEKEIIKGNEVIEENKAESEKYITIHSSEEKKKNTQMNNNIEIRESVFKKKNDIKENIEISETDSDSFCEESIEYEKNNENYITITDEFLNNKNKLLSLIDKINN